jgi:hypothetical protein
LTLAIATLALVGLGAGVGVVASSAGASSSASSIEGVWSFGGGQIAIVPASNGTLVGTVVAETRFVECAHPVGQQIWKDVTPKEDGSYWGLHQWYFADSKCAENPQLGPTAWRALEEPDGSRYLKVCFSDPGTSQPMIAPDGSTSDVTYGCFESGFIAPPPPTGTTTSGGGSSTTGTTGSSVAGFIQRQLPSSRLCLSARRFVIHLAEPRYDPFKTVRVTLEGRAIKTVRKGGYVDAIVSLEGLPAGAFTIKIDALTVLGVRLTGSRTYHTCAAKPRRHKPARLKPST